MATRADAKVGKARTAAPRAALKVVKESARPQPTQPSEQGERAAKDDQTKLSEYNDTYLECREMRHAWKLLGWFTNGALIVQHAQCQRCPTTRTKRYRRNGVIEGTKYEYPEDYQLHGGVQGTSVRAEMINRAVVWGSESEMLGHVLNGRSKGRRNGQ